MGIEKTADFLARLEKETIESGFRFIDVGRIREEMREHIAAKMKLWKEIESIIDKELADRLKSLITKKNPK